MSEEPPRRFSDRLEADLDSFLVSSLPAIATSILPKSGSFKLHGERLRLLTRPVYRKRLAIAERERE